MFTLICCDVTNTTQKPGDINGVKDVICLFIRDNPIHVQCCITQYVNMESDTNMNNVNVIQRPSASFTHDLC